MLEVRKFLHLGSELPTAVGKVTVIGGRSAGCEATYLGAREKGLEVTIVEKQPDLMVGVVYANRSMMLKSCGCWREWALLLTVKRYFQAH